MSDDDENKDVSVLEEEEEQEGLKEDKNETNHLPNIVNKEKVSKKYKSEKSVKFLFREATKARNEHVNATKNIKGKVADLEYEKEREDEADFSTPDSKDSAQTMMQKQQLMKEEDSLKFHTNI